MKKGVLKSFFIFAVLMLSLSLISAQDDVSGQEVEVKIMENLNVSATVNKKEFSPGDWISIRGTVEKNGEPVDGKITIQIDGTYSASLREGSFSFETTLSNKIKSGDYKITIEAKDEEGDIGSTNKSIYIKPIPLNIEIYLNNNSFSPYSQIEASVLLKDQNGEPIETSTILTLYDSRGAEIKRVTVNNGKFDYIVPKDAVPGEWWIYAFSENIRSRRFFSISEMSKISAYFEGKDLKITNLGNVPYKEEIKIIFAGNGEPVTKTESLNIGVGKSQLLELTAPKGSYFIEFRAPDFKKVFSAVPLTGGIIGINSNFSFGGSFATLVALFLLGIIAIAMRIRIKKVRVRKVQDGN